MRELVLQAKGKNALSSELMTTIIRELQAAGDDAVFITGAGDAFSAGLNLKEVATLDRPGMERFLDTLETMVAAIFNHPAPVIAWVNGHAIAGGCVVALACDHRLLVSRDDVKIGLNEVALGLRYPPKTMAMIRHRLPPHSIDRVVLDAGLYDPQTALRLGLVDELVDDLDAARAYAARVARHPRAAYRGAKLQLRGGVLDVDPELTRRFREELIPAWAEPALQARLLAMLKG